MDRYRVLKKLNTNPVFDTYLARPREWDEQGFEVVLQEPHDENNAELVENWSARLYLSTQISSPNLVQVFHLPDEEHSTPFAVIEYIWGEPLHEKSPHCNNGNRKLPALHVIQIVAELAELVERFHKELNVSGIDLSPGNIILGYDNKPRLLGLGLQLPVQPQWASPWKEIVAQKIAYLSPEQLQGEKTTPVSDVYSLGVLLYEHTTNQQAFRGDSVEEIRSLICSGTIDRSPLKHSDFPADLRKIIHRSVSKDPDKRYASALEMSNDLRAFLNNKPHPEEKQNEGSLLKMSSLQKNSPCNDEGFTPDYSGPKTDQLTAIFQNKPQKTAREPGGNKRLRRSAIIRAVHTLRDAIPDEFANTAKSAQRLFTWICSLTAVFLIIATIWHQKNHQWPWETLFSSSDSSHSQPSPAGRVLPDTTGVAVVTVPPGAHLVVNGILVDSVSPTSVQIIPETINQITAYLPDYIPFTSRLDPVHTPIPEAGLTFNLEPQAQDEGQEDNGRILLTTEPEGSSLWIDGTLAGVSPLELSVSPGNTHHITARAAGYLDTVAYVNVREYRSPQDQKTVHLILREDSGSPRIYTYFNIDSYPPGALVSVNEQPVGHVPAGFSREIDQAYQVEISQDGYEPWRETIYPRAGRFEIQTRLFRQATGPSQITIRVSGEDTPGTRIFLGRPGTGANELGSGMVRSLEIDSGSYELTLSYRQTAEEGGQRLRTRIPLTVPPETDLMLNYSWNGQAFELQERTEDPLSID